MIVDDILQMNDFGENPYEYKEGKIESISDPNNLFNAYKLSRRTVAWKASVQRYGVNLLTNITDANRMLNTGSYIMTDPYEFTISERGHTRYVKALYIFDRVIQRSFNDNVLNPIINKIVIYDNSASQIGKGVSFARERFKYHLYQAFLRWGYDCYVILIDFSKFFDNILHDEALRQFKPYMTPEEYDFLRLTFKTFNIDASYMSDEEFLNYRDELFNMLEYSANVPKSILTGEKMMEKSVGIGNQTSQGTGVVYPHEIDNYITIVRGYGLYGRYMDDSFIFAHTKEECYDLLNNINEICKKLGIHINMKKTRIQPISSVITYLKINYKILPSGKIIETVPSRMFKREKDRIDSFVGLYEKNVMNLMDITQCYLSWYGAYIKFDSKNKVRAIDFYFKDKFFNSNYNLDLREWMYEEHKRLRKEKYERIKEEMNYK